MKIFFDVDGVLIKGWHSNPKYRRPWDETIEQDLGLDRQAFKNAFFHEPVTEVGALINACAAGRLDIKDALAKVLPMVGFHDPPQLFLDYWFEKDSHLDQSVLDVVRRLEHLEDVELFLATGQEHYRAAYLWNELDLKLYFNDMFYSAQSGFLKSTPEFFEWINTSLGIAQAERPLLIDDRMEVLEVARAAGWDEVVPSRWTVWQRS